MKNDAGQRDQRKEKETVCKARVDASFRYDVVSDWVIPELRWDAAYKLVNGPLTAEDNQAAREFGTKIFGPLE